MCVTIYILICCFNKMALFTLSSMLFVHYSLYTTTE